MEQRIEKRKTEAREIDCEVLCFKNLPHWNSNHRDGVDVQVSW